MAFSWTTMCFMLVHQLVFKLMFLFQTTAGQSVGNWGPWGECSKSCNGEQTRTRVCTSAASCGKTLEDKRECETSACISLEMIIALAVIGAAILAILIVIIALGCKIKNERKRQKHESKNLAHAIERMYDDSVSTRSQSMRHFPSAESFPEPEKEPEELGLDSFAFDAESLNESIGEVSYSFGADEEYQPKGQVNKERRMSLKVVSVTETQAIDKGLEPVTQKPPPIYAVVIKPNRNPDQIKAPEPTKDVNL